MKKSLRIALAAAILALTAPAAMATVVNPLPAPIDHATLAR